jgi:hypothetical protein
LRKQYDGVKTQASSGINVIDRQNELDIARERYEKLVTYIPQCEAERKEKGWGVPGGPTSSYAGQFTAGGQAQVSGLAVNSEQALFCNLPVVGGYSHDKFVNETGVTHPAIPMVNAKKVMDYEVMTIKSVLAGALTGNPKKKAYVNININCNVVFNAKLLDYKGGIPGASLVTETPIDLPEENTPYGNCTYLDESVAEYITEEECLLSDGTWEEVTPDNNPGGDTEGNNED